MKYSAILSFLTVLSLNSIGAATVKIQGPSESSVIINGPSTTTIIKGPDGSFISSVVHGGTIISPGHHGGVIISRTTKPGVVVYPNHVPIIPVAGQVGIPVIYAAPVHGYRHDVNAFVVSQ